MNESGSFIKHPWYLGVRKGLSTLLFIQAKFLNGFYMCSQLNALFVLYTALRKFFKLKPGSLGMRKD